MDYGEANVPTDFATKHYPLLSFLIVLSLISSFNSCGVCDSEQTPV